MSDNKDDELRFCQTKYYKLLSEMLAERNLRKLWTGAAISSMMINVLLMGLMAIL